MNHGERKRAALEAFKVLDPNCQGGVPLESVAEFVAYSDEEFLKWEEFKDRLSRILGINRKIVNYGQRYSPHIFGVVGELEEAGVIDSTLEELPEGVEQQPRKVYRYLYGNLDGGSGI